MTATIYDQVPSECMHCRAKLPSRRTIISNRRRWLLQFISIFVGVIAFWIFGWQWIGSNEEQSLIGMLLAERNGLLGLAIVAGLAHHVTRKMPDTVVIRCAVCRHENRFRVRFLGQAKAESSPSHEPLPQREQESSGHDA